MLPMMTRYTTIELFNSSLKEKTKMKGVLEILTSASEFAAIPVPARPPPPPHTHTPPPPPHPPTPPPPQPPSHPARLRARVSGPGRTRANRAHSEEKGFRRGAVGRPVPAGWRRRCVCVFVCVRVCACVRIRTGPDATVAPA